MTFILSTAVAGTALEVLAKHRPDRKPWDTTNLLDLCENRRELKRKKDNLGEAEAYRRWTQYQQEGVVRESSRHGYQCNATRLKLTFSWVTVKQRIRQCKNWQLLGKAKGKINTIPHKDGEFLAENEEILSRQVDYSLFCGLRKRPLTGYSMLLYGEQSGISERYNHETTGDPTTLSLWLQSVHDVRQRVRPKSQWAQQATCARHGLNPQIFSLSQYWPTGNHRTDRNNQEWYTLVHLRVQLSFREFTLTLRLEGRVTMCWHPWRHVINLPLKQFYTWQIF